MKHLWTLFISLFFISFGLRAQSIGPSVLNANGGSTSSNGNTYEYAIGGVVAAKTYSSANLVVTPGVLQPLMDNPNSVQQPGILSENLSVYPNPVDDILFLQPSFGKKGTMIYILSDAKGRTIARREIPLEQGNEQQQIPMSHYAVGQYNLNVQWTAQGKTFISAYKIQKVK